MQTTVEIPTAQNSLGLTSSLKCTERFPNIRGISHAPVLRRCTVFLCVMPLEEVCCRGKSTHHKVQVFSSHVILGKWQALACLFVCLFSLSNIAWIETLLRQLLQGWDVWELFNSMSVRRRRWSWTIFFFFWCIIASGYRVIDFTGDLQ